MILCSQDQVNGFHCTCPSGYFGDQCQSDTDDCISQPCMNSATCHVSTSILSTNIVRSYKILCSTIILVYACMHACMHVRTVKKNRLVVLTAECLSWLHYLLATRGYSYIKQPVSLLFLLFSHSGIGKRVRNNKETTSGFLYN